MSEEITVGVLDRLMALQIIPKEGDLTTIRLIRDMRSWFSFSEEEHATLKFGPPCASCAHIEEEHNEEADHDFLPTPNSLGWAKDEDGNDTLGNKVFDLGNKSRGIICDALQELSQHKKLTEQHLSLWDKFISEAPKKKKK